MRAIQRIGDNWFFCLGDTEGASSAEFDHSRWQKIDIPHDWAIDSPIDCPDDFEEAQDFINPSTYRWKSWQGFFNRYGVAWYRRSVCFPEAERHFIEFDGVFHECDIYLNGAFIGHHHYGYTSFGFEVSGHVRIGENVLAVRVDNSFRHLSDRWYSGCGIYRPVHIISTSAVKFQRHGIIVEDGAISKENAEIRIIVKIDADHTEGKRYRVKITLTDNQGNIAAEQMDGIQDCISIADLTIQNPKLWSPENPRLYSVTVGLMEKDGVLDEIRFTYGFRDIQYSPEDGMRLNGKRIKLKGVNLHHDLGAVGSAWNKGLMRYRMQKLKELGCNAIRTAHNPPASEFLDLCDEMGFLVMEEAFDKWDTLRYGLIFDRCWESDLTEMISRDRNHPCVFCWSVGNEVNDQAGYEMLKRLAMLAGKVKELDAARPVTYAMEPHVFVDWQKSLSPDEKAELVKKIKEYVDIVSGNYHEQYYEQYYELMPDILVIGTETLPFYRNSALGDNAYTARNPWFDVAENDFVLGQFVWPGIDYLGESVWPARMWSGGLIDSTGHIKERGYLTQSLWSDTPMVRISVYDEDARDMKENGVWSAPPMANHWNMKNKKTHFLKAFIFTNCEEVLVYVNDGLLIKADTTRMQNGYLEVNLPNTPGTLMAKGYISEEPVCEHVLRTAGEPDHIELTELYNSPYENEDIIIMSAEIVDSDGSICPFYDKDITFLCSGLTFIATDSGDPTDHTPYKSNTRKPLNGRCVALCKKTGARGGRVTAISDRFLSVCDVR